MSDAPGSTEQKARRLNGWKEIAVYLDKSVRTVQRWEADYGLPVRRLGTGGAESVSAFVEDLQRWREGAEAEAARQSIGATEAVSTGELHPLPGDREGLDLLAPSSTSRGLSRAAVQLVGGRRLRWNLVGAILLVAVLAAGAWWLVTAARNPAEPSSVEILEEQLLVRDVGGRVLWTHRFDAALSRQPWNFRIVDIDADGHQEVLGIPHSALASPSSVRFYCFDFRGRVRWTYRHDTGQTFGTTIYSPPFRPDLFALSDAPHGRKYIWVISRHVPSYPSVLHKLDAAGAIQGEYWSAGHISEVRPVQSGGRRVVLVAARNNEYQSASLALLDEDRPSGSSPSVDPRYQCRACPPGGPLAYVVFPKPERLRQLSGTAGLQILGADPGGSVVAWVNFGEDFGVQAPVVYTLDRQLRPIRIEPSDTFETGCLELVRRRAIDPYAPGTGLRQLRSVLWWNGSDLVDVLPPVGTARAGQ
jgi:hypothetical protein